MSAAGSAVTARWASTASSKLDVTATLLDAIGVERPAQHLGRVQLLDVVGGLEQAHPGILPNSD